MRSDNEATRPMRATEYGTATQPAFRSGMTATDTASAGTGVLSELDELEKMLTDRSEYMEKIASSLHAFASTMLGERPVSEPPAAQTMPHSSGGRCGHLRGRIQQMDRAMDQITAAIYRLGA